jgi:hypothetical protein
MAFGESGAGVCHGRRSAMEKVRDRTDVDRPSRYIYTNASGWDMVAWCESEERHVERESSRHCSDSTQKRRLPIHT